MIDDPSMSELEDLLLARMLDYEQRLLDPAIRRDPSAVGALLTEDFREFGSSGRIFSRAAVLDMLAAEPVAHHPIATISDFTLTSLAPDAALVTYTATRPSRTTLRSSLWVSRRGQWLMLFHQGTPVHG